MTTKDTKGTKVFKKVTVWRRLGALLLMSSLAFPCGLDKNKLDPAWRVPDDKGKIRSVDKTKYVFKMLDGPEGVMATKVFYKDPGLVMKAPDGRDVFKVELHGKVFAIYGNAYFPSINDKGKIDAWAGCLTTVIVYDMDGNGSFETVEDAGWLKANNPTMRIPSWLTVGQKSESQSAK